MIIACRCETAKIISSSCRGRVNKSVIEVQYVASRVSNKTINACTQSHTLMHSPHPLNLKIFVKNKHVFHIVSYFLI